MAGYEPQASFTGCLISDLYSKFYIKKKSTILKTQNLVMSSVDGTIAVRTEQIYNNMSKAMCEFNKALFNPLQKSYYNETGIQILKECRTTPPVGEPNKFYRVLNPKTEKYDKCDRNNNRNRCKKSLYTRLQPNYRNPRLQPV